jgi:hypothetical protein
VTVRYTGDGLSQQVVIRDMAATTSSPDFKEAIRQARDADAKLQVFFGLIEPQVVDWVCGGVPRLPFALNCAGDGRVLASALKTIRGLLLPRAAGTGCGLRFELLVEGAAEDSVAEALIRGHRDFRNPSPEQYVKALYDGLRSRTTTSIQSRPGVATLDVGELVAEVLDELYIRFVPVKRGLDSELSQTIDDVLSHRGLPCVSRAGSVSGPSDFEDARLGARVADIALATLLADSKADVEEWICGDLPVLPFSFGRKEHGIQFASALETAGSLVLPRAASVEPDSKFYDLVKQVTKDAVAAELIRAYRDKRNPTRDWFLRTLYGIPETTKDKGNQGIRLKATALVRAHGVVDPFVVDELVNEIFTDLYVGFEPLIRGLDHEIARLARIKVGEWRAGMRLRSRPAKLVHAPPVAQTLFPVEVAEERLRTIAALPRPAHRILAFLLHHELKWSPNRVVRFLVNSADRTKDPSLTEVHNKYVLEFSEKSLINERFVRDCLLPLASRLGPATLSRYLPPGSMEPRKLAIGHNLSRRE